MLMREEIEPGVIFGPQLDADGLRSLPKRDILTVIDLRRGDENGNLLPPHKEERFAQDLGLAYHHIPIDWRNLRPGPVDTFREVLRRSPPVYVHSRHRGERAALLLLIDKAVEEGWSGPFAARTAEELGILRAGTRADEFVSRYVSSRTSGGT